LSGTVGARSRRRAANSAAAPTTADGDDADADRLPNRIVQVWFSVCEAVVRAPEQGCKVPTRTADAERRIARNRAKLLAPTPLNADGNP